MASQKMQKTTKSSNNNILHPQYAVDITMTNKTSSNLALSRVFTWAGNPINPGFPESIPADGKAQFTYLRGLDDGSVAAVVYSSSEEKSTPYSFVLSWDASADNTQTPNKVYVNCGPSSVIEGYTFEIIREYLTLSGTESKAEDLLTKTTASAGINDFKPNIATVEATIDYKKTVYLRGNLRRTTIFRPQLKKHDIPHR